MRKVPPDIYRHVYYFFFEDIYILRQQIHIKAIQKYKEDKITIKKKSHNYSSGIPYLF